MGKPLLSFWPFKQLPETRCRRLAQQDSRAPSSLKYGQQVALILGDHSEHNFVALAATRHFAGRPHSAVTLTSSRQTPADSSSFAPAHVEKVTFVLAVNAVKAISCVRQAFAV